ncbi:MAG: hypothetical protein EZS28_049515 [Streblomastix strix]|uniref:Uncharacterized protein n=1 Tax=Streblomastix strix TaxID=222440 RepID=A0A5J4T9P2_9EUKA|nr:MAG: hypothetical protein EZS28_049515 [Streblomastix strix]
MVLCLFEDSSKFIVASIQEMQKWLLLKEFNLEIANVTIVKFAMLMKLFGAVVLEVVKEEGYEIGGKFDEEKEEDYDAYC